jgi:RNA polymerase sigma-70 factor (ECF subfamily)
MIVILFGMLSDEQRELVEQIFKNNQRKFQSISFHIVKSKEAAEDVVSTAFIKIMDNIEKISALPCPKITAFCVTIVKNASLDVLRQAQKNVPVDDWDRIADENFADDTVFDADVYVLREAIDQLAPDDRRLLYLRHTMEMGYKEIGKLFSISEETARKRGQRLLEKLRRLCEGG